MFLADVIEEMCGKRPDVMSVEKGRPCTVEKAMFVGEAGSQTEQAEATPDAFRIIAKNGCVRFLGRADFAVFDWCERELGLRYYCEEGRCVEKRDEIVVRPVDYSDRPVFAKRVFGSRLRPRTSPFPRCTAVPFRRSSRPDVSRTSPR